jgi:HSP20 family protein
MADVNVKKQNPENQEKAVQTQKERGVSHRGWDPFSFSITPSDFFRSDPFAVMRRFQDEMDRTFSRFFGKGDGERATWSPAIEVAERDGKLQVHAELPGLKPEDVKVEVTDDALIIQGERKFEHEEKKEGVYRSERRYGQFYREIPLPEGTNPEQAKAEFKDGVLQVVLPLPEHKNNRHTIPIQGGTSASPGGSAAQK